MARLVKCVYCEKTINRDTDEFIQTPQKRYAHAECASQQEIDREQRKQLEQFIFELLGENINFGMLNKQIKTYQDEYKFTISGILGTLYYIANIKQLSFNKSQGIGLVPYYYSEARAYWNKVKNAQTSSAGIEIENKQKQIIIKPPQPKPLIKQKFQTLSELEDEINGI